MKSTLDLIDIVYTILDESPLKAEITGSIYKARRLADSQLEDVVINSLPITTEQIQSAIVNVNIHVPDIDVSTNNISDKMPDNVRLNELYKIAYAALHDKWSEDHSIMVQQQTTFRDEEAKDHYINIRLEINNINI